jgi:hypothetical protein
MTEHDYDALSVVFTRIIQQLGALAEDLETFLQEFRKEQEKKEDGC